MVLNFNFADMRTKGIEATIKYVYAGIKQKDKCNCNNFL